MSLLVIKNESFKLSDLKTDVTDFEVSLIYDFLIKHEYDIHSYSGYEQSQTELLESNFKEEIYYKDMGADRNDIRSQWIKSLTDKGFPAQETIESPSGISQNSSQDMQLKNMRFETAYNKYNVTINLFNLFQIACSHW